MTPLVLAAVVAAGEDLQTLAGVTLGSNVQQVLMEHPTGQYPTGSGRCCRWSRRVGGTVTVSFDGSGNVAMVDFQADKGEDGKVDLPCVGAFLVRGSPANLSQALSKTPCSAFNGAGYSLPDRSVVDIRFSGPGDGQLAEATWYRPSGLTFIDYLLSNLTYVGGFARMYYGSECATNERASLVQQPRLPSISFLPPPQGDTGMVAVWQMFRNNPNVTVVQDRFGMLRITIGSVSSTVLQTRLPTLTFDPESQYTDLSATETIAIAADIYAKQHGLPFHLAPFVIDHLVSGPRNGAPHLPPTMQSITIDDALDAVARTFRGVVTYGECTQPDSKIMFRVGFIHGP